MSEKLLGKYMGEHLERILKEFLHASWNLLRKFYFITESNNAKYLKEFIGDFLEEPLMELLDTF